MGRCNNRRAQERAAQDRNTPSRARFSKGPPKKNAGRGGGRNSGGRGGRDGRGGRGRGGRANESVVQKLQDRAKQQRADIGGISIVKKQAVGGGQVRRKKHPMDGIDVSKLDVITLSPESVAIVERLLRAYNVWDGDVKDEEKESDEQFDAYDVSGTIEEADEVDDTIESESESIQQKPLDQEQMDNDLSRHSFTLLHGDDSYDDYHGDYEDEPDYHNGRDVEMMIDRQDQPRESYLDDSDEDLESVQDIQKSQEDNDQILIESSLFRHLTQHYSFQQHHVIEALRASHKRLYSVKQKSSELQEQTSPDDEGLLLEMAMDWLSLHLKESDLRRGFIVQKPSRDAATKTFMQSKGLQDHPGLKQTIKAVPHESISLMPKLTETQYKKETFEAMCQWKRQELSTEFVRMGFHMNEIELAMSAFQEQLNALFATVDVSSEKHDTLVLHPVSILDGVVFKSLIQGVETVDGNASSLDPDLDKEMEEASMLERDQEKEVLEAIYAEDFLVLNESHCQITLNIANLAPPARSECHLHIFTRKGYPLTSPPTVWFVNTTLPPSLLRRISIYIQTKAKELIGQPSVYDLVEFLVESVSLWQKEFTDEETRIEENTSHEIDKNVNADSDEENEDEIDFYTTTLTTEEIKKLSRRQRQKLRAAEKSYARDEIRLEKQRQKEANDEERRQRIRVEDSTINSRRAEQVVEQRWRQWVEEEAEKAARRAMNDAFLRDEGREKAREAAEVARKEMLRFHGELDDSDKEDAATASHDSGEELHVEQTVCVATSESDEKVEEPLPVSLSTNDSSQSAQKPRSGATAKTLAFTEKLRNMYEQKAREKAAGISGNNAVELKTIELTKATVEVHLSKNETISTEHIPAPIVTPSPCMENILQDILSTQQEQPWLVQPDARVPTIGTSQNSDNRDMAGKKDKLSNAMKIELERKYSNKNQSRCGKDKGRQRKFSKFDEMLASRSKLPAYKMRNQVLETIRNVSELRVCTFYICFQTSYSYDIFTIESNHCDFW